MPRVEEAIGNGLVMSWADLREFFESAHDVHQALVEGLPNEETHVAVPGLSIELHDSSCWILTSEDRELLEEIDRRIPDSETRLST
jgi:hypothetical protein